MLIARLVPDTVYIAYAFAFARARTVHRSLDTALSPGSTTVAVPVPVADRGQTLHVAPAACAGQLLPQKYDINKPQVFL